MAKKGIITFDVEYCKGCELCVEQCIFGVIAMSKHVNNKGYNYPEVIKANGCTGCTNCATICPDAVITVYRN